MPESLPARRPSAFADTGSALSTVLMAVALIGIFAYARILGSRTIEEYL